jgi:CHAD domain-containing protein
MQPGPQVLRSAQQPWGEEAAVPTQHVEIERKFDVPPSFALPDLGSVPGIAGVSEPEERHLEAVYYDTADLRLARARVTLRRRTGGPDEGWHAKLPGSRGARRELHVPLGQPTRTPPEEVQSPVRGLVRTAALEPVATVQTRRQVTHLCDSGDRVLAELADDVVTATAMGAAPGEPATVLTWREVEVELVDGDEALLDAVGERLVAAGAQPSPSESKLQRVLAQRLAVLGGGSPDGRAGPLRTSRRRVPAGAVVTAALEEQVQALQQADLLIRTGQPHGVHDLRVACRRLRSILAAFRTVLDAASTDPLREELRWVGRQLSGTRDTEVALTHLRELAEGQPEELVLGPVAARLRQATIKAADAARRVALQTVGDSRYLRLVDDLVDMLETPPLTATAGEPARGVLVDALRGSGRRLRRRIETARADPTDAHLHDVRKAAKRLRYTAEVAEPVLGGRARRVVRRAKRVQNVLGEHRDTVVTREHCRALGLAAEAAGEIAWTYGRLHALEEARAERAVRTFWELEPSLARALRRVTRS